MHVTLLNFTFTERFGTIPGTVLGTDESGGPVSIHGETRGTLETDCVVVGEIIPQPHAIGWHSRVTTVDYCTKPNRVKRCELIKTGRTICKLSTAAVEDKDREEGV